MNTLNMLLDPRKIQYEKIVNPLNNNRKDNAINVAVFPTGGGKTYNMINHVIPSMMSKGCNKFIWVTPYLKSVDQEYNDMMKYSYKNNIRIFTFKGLESVDDFMSLDENIPAIIVMTLAGFATTTRGGELLEYFLSLNPKSRSLIWDEIQFGSTSQSEYYIKNIGFKVDEFKARIFKAVNSLTKNCSNIIGLTATPVWEQKRGSALEFENVYHIVNPGAAPVKYELAHLTSSLRQMHTFSLNKKFYFRELEDVLDGAIKDFLNYVGNLKLQSQFLKDVFPEIKFLTKRVMIVNLSRNTKKNKFYDELETLKTVLSKFDEIDKDMKCILVDTSNDQNEDSGSYLMSLNGDKEKIDPARVQKILLNKENFPYMFYVIQEKGKFGMNVENISHVISMRERPQTEVKLKEDKVTISTIQLLGRSSRNFYGLDFSDTQIYFIPDVIEFLIDNYSNHENFQDLVKYVDLSNTHTIMLPDTDTQNKASSEWINSYSYDFKDSLFKLLLHNEKTCTCPPTFANRIIWENHLLKQHDNCLEKFYNNECDIPDNIIENMENV